MFNDVTYIFVTHLAFEKDILLINQDAYTYTSVFFLNEVNHTLSFNLFHAITDNAILLQIKLCLHSQSLLQRNKLQKCMCFINGSRDVSSVSTYVPV